MHTIRFVRSRRIEWSIVRHERVVVAIKDGDPVSHYLLQVTSPHLFSPFPHGQGCGWPVAPRVGLYPPVRLRKAYCPQGGPLSSRELDVYPPVSDLSSHGACTFSSRERTLRFRACNGIPLSLLPCDPNPCWDDHQYRHKNMPRQTADHFHSTSTRWAGSPSSLSLANFPQATSPHT